jgi:hypothetical protein
MKTIAKRAAVTVAGASLCITGFTAVADAHGRSGDRHRGDAGSIKASALRHLLHADGVVKRSDGSFLTVAEQRGKASGVSATSITVTSDDGFARTYVVNAATTLRPRHHGDDSASKPALADGATVVVLAKKSGDSWIATRIKAVRAKSTS